MKRLSIIIPVYNAGSYLENCLGSILTDHSEDFEVILVDDGSSDGSQVICDDYSAKDSRIRVIHQANSGVSTARNVGIEAATGEWLFFLDADDWIEKFSSAFLSEVSTNIDCIFLPFRQFYEGKMESAEVLYLTDSKQVFTEQHLNDLQLKSSCGKFIRRSAIHNIRFNSRVIVGEDNIFILQIFKAISAFTVQSSPIYIYRCFAATRKYNQDIDRAIFSMNQLFNTYSNLDIYNAKFETDMFCNYRSFCQDSINSTPEKWFKNPFVRMIYKRIRKNLTKEYRIRYFIVSHIPSKVHKLLLK